MHFLHVELIALLLGFPKFQNTFTSQYLYFANFMENYPITFPQRKTWVTASFCPHNFSTGISAYALFIFKRGFFNAVCSFICQVFSIRRQRRDLFGLRVKLPPVITSLTKLKGKGNLVKCLAQGHNKRTYRPILTLSPFNAKRLAGKLWIPTFTVFWSDSARESNLGLPTTRHML